MGILYPSSAEFRADSRKRQEVLAWKEQIIINITPPVPNFQYILHKHKNLKTPRA